jgi:superfamily I DNA/RNA helicase
LFLTTYVKTRESAIIGILKSSKYIESRIKKTYRNIYPTLQGHPNVRAEQMPTFVGFLYDLILELNDLPTQVEFIQQYMKKYYDNVVHDQIIYHAYVDILKRTYPSLVRDLHFYFKLQESKLFEDVQLLYSYDIEAKQDLVLTLGEKKMGLQLFNGDDSHIPKKKEQSRRRRITLGYPDFFLPLHGTKSNPVNIGLGTMNFFVHSDKDVKTVYNELIKCPIMMQEEEETTYVLPSQPSIASKLAKPTHTKGMQQHTQGVFHSYIYVGKNKLEDEWKRVKTLMQNGVRIEWISPHNLTLPKDISFFSKNLRIHSWKEAVKYNLNIVDGQYNEQEGKILETIGKKTGFNFEQYMTEHAATNKHLIVEAGAGSGKTETMISRILYLLHIGKLSNLEETIMVTFTNEAADHMKSKLSKKLYGLFEMTGNIRYIEWSEQITSMRIMTIPSFAKTVIQDFSSDIGIGREFSIRTLTLERRNIISDVLNEYISQNKLHFKELGEIREYQMIKMVDNFWGQLEQKGISLDLHEKIKWGNSPKKKIEQRYQKMLKEVLVKCEKRFNELKLSLDAVTVNDLTQKINDINKFLDFRQLSKPFKYLFVDEFQDTDDIQINLVKTLTNLTKAQLFVVGDIKQSIYRFRGANYTAFDVLAKALGENNVNRNLKLIKNYRTTHEILESIEDIFDVWRNDSKEILPKDKQGKGKTGIQDNRLLSTVISKKYKNSYDVKQIFKTKDHDYTKEITNLYQSLVRDAEDIKDNKPVVLAILVRTNFQAKQMRKTLEQMRKKDPTIKFEIVTGGSLFSSHTAKDLFILFNALCYERDPESYFALYQTPFTNKPFNPAKFIHLEGNRNKIPIEKLMIEVEGYKEAKVDLRLKPPLHVIYQFLMTNNFESVLAADNVQEHEIQKYRLNLYRILELASEGISSSMVSIHHLRDWLEVQIATNRNEDEMEIEIKDCEKLIKVLTVHKAKGLEFDTVLIPYTYQAFEKKKTQEIIVTKDEKEIKVGWILEVTKEGQQESIQSILYSDLKDSEKIENIREEARLLYVALTRAKNRLVVRYDKSKYKKNNRYNWADLIRLGKERG